MLPRSSTSASTITTIRSQCTPKTTATPTSKPTTVKLTATIVTTEVQTSAVKQRPTTKPGTVEPVFDPLEIHYWKLKAVRFLEIEVSTAPPPKTLPPDTNSCAVCVGPAFLCEKAFAPTPCPAPDNYCINTVINHKDGTRTVDRKCGDFDTCYREWFQGSSDDDKCRQFDENNEQRLDLQCTYCCMTDDCNIPLRPDAASLYKPA